MNRLYVVVLAGGSGERFWPLSTPSHPKQFPPLLEGRSFFQHTVERATRLVGDGRVLVATRRSLLSIVREQLPGFPEEKYFHTLLQHFLNRYPNALRPVYMGQDTRFKIYEINFH